MGIVDALDHTHLQALADAVHGLPRVVAGPGLAIGLPRCHGIGGLGQLPGGEQRAGGAFRGVRWPGVPHGPFARCGRIRPCRQGAGVGRLVVAGGQTSGACAMAWGITQLSIGPQIDPGVPWCHAAFGRPGLHLALKSGNFGHRECCAHAFEMLRRRTVMSASTGDDAALRDAVCRVGCSLFARGDVHASAGNVSVRLDDGGMLTRNTHRVALTLKGVWSDDGILPPITPSFVAKVGHVPAGALPPAR
jgi:hypothetical protein